MATKCIVLGQPEQEKKGKPIEFVKALNNLSELVATKTKPKEWVFIELLSKNYPHGYDLMFAYYGERNSGDRCLYLGHWNDGFVE